MVIARRRSSGSRTRATPLSCGTFSHLCPSVADQSARSIPGVRCLRCRLVVAYRPNAPSTCASPQRHERRSQYLPSQNPGMRLMPRLRVRSSLMRGFSLTPAGTKIPGHITFGDKFPLFFLSSSVPKVTLAKLTFGSSAGRGDEPRFLSISSTVSKAGESHQQSCHFNSSIRRGIAWEAISTGERPGHGRPL